MTRYCPLPALLAAAALAGAADPPADRGNVDAALKLTQAAAAEYAILR